MPPYVAAELRKAVEKGDVESVIGDVAGLTSVGDVGLLLDDGRRVSGDVVVLATGFRDEVPEAKLVSQIAGDFSLPTDDLGYPVPDTDLGWRSSHEDARVYVTGFLGQLSLGPSAGNIIGAQTAAKRIVASFRKRFAARPSASSATRVPWTWRHVSA
jgi:lysine/ornithine N-monooxygenase